jgi:hypothetical protein
MHKTTGIAGIGRNVHKTSRAGGRFHAVTPHHLDETAIAMAAIELRNVTKKFATADSGTYTALRDNTGFAR